ncbi:hypothetical protein [Streptomyces sp. CA-111067]|uniref:hypothetical protein n=1 Tax=Streptomyces sp. CA-111067 TaxID=3240046 RepID=UPI003D99F699
MSVVPNRRDDEVRRLLDTPHPMVPADLPLRAVVRGRRIVRRRRAAHHVLLALLAAAVLAGIVVAVMMWPHHDTPQTPSDDGYGGWWSPVSLGPVPAARPFSWTL